MLAPQRTWFVKQLLDDGHDPAFIARKAGVSVATVKAIGAGEHRHLSAAVPLGQTSRYRCPECGAALDERTFCLACRLAEFGLEAPDVCTDGEGNAGPGFDLRGEERRRWFDSLALRFLASSRQDSPAFLIPSPGNNLRRLVPSVLRAGEGHARTARRKGVFRHV